MTDREWALLFHLVGVVLLFSGMTVAAVALEGARRRERPGEIAALLGLTRTGVALVAAGALVLVGSGLWLIEVSKLAALVRHHDPAELAVLGCVLALSGFAGRQLAPALIRRP